MKVSFYVWGATGFAINCYSALYLVLASGIGVGTSAYFAASALVWIGGMVFFGLGSLLQAPDSDIVVTAHGDPNYDGPYDENSQEGKAWARGVAARKRD